MAIFKCKICGGALEIDSAQSVATCEYCGTKQTLPKLDDNRRANLYDRANHFRRNNDFDKAMGIYENSLDEDNTDAEAYWSIVLCRYGIEYVEDPVTHKRVPTVNRVQYTSIFDDEDYKSALANADGYQREIYESEANAINEIQKGFLAISQKEEPFDVFICYKETDVSGRRTQDSVLATELYHELTQEGFKVFFSRITLEDKLGVAYEPYIFAALNSAKVMVVVGTRPEHFNAVWVKNEWSRYLVLIKNGAKKTLIPAYRDMDPYDLPEEFSHLQAQDMSKLGFMQDMIRGIKKIIEADVPKATTKETVITTNVAPNITTLIKRAFMFLEDGEFDRADEFCEQILNQDPENAHAYLIKLMIELEVREQEQLKDCAAPFDDSNNYKRAYRFGDLNLKSVLSEYIEYINNRNKEELLEDMYVKAKHIMSCGDFQEAAEKFGDIKDYKDSAILVNECLENAEKEKIALKQKIEKEIKEAERLKKRNKKIGIIASVIIGITILFIVILTTIIIPNGEYKDGIEYMSKCKYEEAISIFEKIKWYKDSETQILECKYKIAENLINDGKYRDAIYAFEKLDGFKDCDKQIEKIKQIQNQERQNALSSNKYSFLKNVAVGDIINFGAFEQDGIQTTTNESIEWLVLDKQEDSILVISKDIIYAHKYEATEGNLYDVTWDNSGLRVWLNQYFYNTFNIAEQSLINESINETSSTQTKDSIFILSVAEVNKYFPNTDDRIAKPTQYAINISGYEGDSDMINSWWLRSTGGYSYNPSAIWRSGKIYGWSHSADVGVRPAMWISIE